VNNILVFRTVLSENCYRAVESSVIEIFETFIGPDVVTRLV